MKNKYVCVFLLIECCFLVFGWCFMFVMFLKSYIGR